MDINELTPVEYINNIYFKREDKFNIFNVCGGKARSAYQLISDGIERGYTHFVTAGSRHSPQCEIVSCICENLNVHCHLFMPKGKETSVIKTINNNYLSEIHRTKIGYNSVICKWSRDFSEENNYYYIPFGMECFNNIEITKHQVKNIPNQVKRIIIPVGSGMSFISVLNGLEYYKRTDIEVLGVSVGKDITKNIEKYLNAPNIKYTIVKSEVPYDKDIKDNILCGITLDKTYEAKCISYVKPNDMLWIVGIRSLDNK